MRRHHGGLSAYGPVVLDEKKIDQLLTRVRREVDDGLSPGTQIAVGYQGEVVVEATFGVPDDSRFVVFSATKGFIAAARTRQWAREPKVRTLA